MKTRHSPSLLDQLSNILAVNRSAVPRLLEVYARGGLQGGAPDGDPPAADPSDHLRSTIATMAKTIDDLRNSGTATGKQLKDATDALEGFRKSESDRASAIFGALPDASRRKLEPFREKLQLADWIGLLGAEQTSVAALTPNGGIPTILPPPTGSVRPAPYQPGDTHVPSPLARKIMRDNMVDEGVLRSLTATDKDGRGNATFSVDDLRDYFGKMKRPEILRVSLSNANQRDNG